MRTIQRHAFQLGSDWIIRRILAVHSRWQHKAHCLRAHVLHVLYKHFLRYLVQDQRLEGNLPHWHLSCCKQLLLHASLKNILYPLCKLKRKPLLAHLHTYLII